MKKVKDFLKENYSKILPVLFAFLMWLYTQFSAIKSNGNRIEQVNQKFKKETEEIYKDIEDIKKDFEKKFDVSFAMINKMSDEMNYKIGYTQGKLDGYIEGSKK